MSTLSYLDAATGSMIASVFVGGFAAILLVVRQYWLRFMALFSESSRQQLEAIRALSAEEAQQDDEENSEESAESLKLDS